MTAKKKKPTDNDLLRKQLHEAVRAIRSLQEEFQRTRAAAQTPQETNPVTPVSVSRSVSLTQLVDDLDLAVDALQASVTRLETRLTPLLPNEMGIVAQTSDVFNRVMQAGDTTMSSQILLSIAHIRILSSIVDELTATVNV